MEELPIRVLSLLLLISIANGFQSPPACSAEGIECDYDENSLIDSVSQVYSEEECRQICEDQLECAYITYFNASANPYSNICLTFKTCEYQVSCTNCVTQNMDCFRTCGANVVGHMDENIIDMLANINTELDCKTICSETDKCSFYTYHLEEDPLYHQLCVLLTDLLPPIEPSDSTSTGPADCYSSECSFDVNGDRLMSLMVTEDQVDITVNVSGLCEITILAVGGGGRGHGQGGGSGYLQYQKIWLSSGITSLHATAGAYSGASSSVTFNGISIVANPGQEGELDNDGGAGYCGGGDYHLDSDNGYSGGYDGSDGGGSLGGSGTHEDISEYVFTTWKLTPGGGGSPVACGSGNQCGGGGGGVMVDGSGPNTTYPSGKGKGYGGGSGSGNKSGLPGLVLLEISSG